MGSLALRNLNISHLRNRGTMVRLEGYAWMSVAILIWASWLVLTSSGVTTNLSPIDLAGLRAFVPALFLSPLLWRHRQEIAKLGVRRCLALTAYGAPFTLCVGYGLGYAPVAHAGAMVPSLMPVIVTFASWLVFGQRASAPHVWSAALIVAGAAAIVLRSTGVSASGDTWVGHILFLTAAVFWACFTLTVRRHGVSPFLATSIVGTISILGLAPMWALSGLSSFAEASAPDVLFQIVFQGIITGLVSLYAFGRALRLLGLVATRLSALTPAVATLLAIPILSQVPDRFELAALGLVVGGLMVASIPPGDADAHASHRSKTL